TIIASLHNPLISGTVSPDRSVTGPIGNRIAPIASPMTATSVQAVKQNVTIIRYLVTSRRTRPAGTVSNVLSVPRPASPATLSPETTATDSGSTSVISTKIASRDRKTPFSATCPMNSPAPDGPPAPGGGVLILSTMPRKIGAAASTANIARLRGRR